MNKQVLFRTNGCAVLTHETERIAKFFRLNGWIKTDSLHNADIIVITCCGVTHNEEDEASAMISELERGRKTGSLLVVSGCLPSFAAERIQTISPDARLITKSSDFNTLIGASVPISEVYYNAHSEIGIDAHYTESMDDDEKLAMEIDRRYSSSECHHRYEFCTMRRYIWQGEAVYQIKVSQGCPGNCSYCATKLAIGNVCSEPESLVLHQFREGLDSSYKYFLLVGDEIGSYGNDFGSDIIALIDKMYAISPDVTLAIRYIHPDIFVRYYERLKPYFANGYINYFCCAIQSASPSVLKGMNRNPDIEPFVRCMEDMNRNGYRVNKHSQIIVGFPGETGDDVLHTLRCLIRCDFDHININIFSRRRGTRAYALTDTVDDSTKHERYELFREWQKQNKYAKMYSAIKKVVLAKS